MEKKQLLNGITSIVDNRQSYAGKKPALRILLVLTGVWLNGG